MPDAVVAVPAIPRTLSGKKLEVPVKRILLGMDPDIAASRDALADPGSLAPFEALAAEHTTRVHGLIAERRERGEGPPAKG